MPQLDLEFWPPQIVWLFLTFAALYFLMARIALPRIAVVLEQRRDRIANDLSEASRLKIELEEAINSYEIALKKARAEAQAIVAHGQSKLQVELNAEKLKMERQIAERLRESEEKIASLARDSVNEVHAAASDVVEVIVQKLVGFSVPKKEIADMIESRRKMERQ